MAGRYQAYPEYKDSGLEWLGELPSHWEAKRLGQFFEERREKVSDKDYPALSVTMQGIVPQLETAAKTDAGDNRKRVKKDDFVINSRSDRKGSSGVSPHEGSVSLISIVLEPRGIEPSYAHHLLRSYPFQEEFYRFGKGIVADLWSTNSSEMKNISIPDLPLPEQKQIARFLDHETAKIDRLIKKQQELIALIKEKRQAVISHAVTKGISAVASAKEGLNPDMSAGASAKEGAKMKDSGVEWLGQVPEHWEVVPLKYMADSVNTGGTPKDESSFSADGEVEWFTPGDFSDKLTIPAAKKRVTSIACKRGDAKTYRPDSVLVIGIGATLGRVTWCDRRFSCNQQINVVEVNKSTDAKFLTFALIAQEEQMRNTASAATLAIMNQDKTKGLWLARPSKPEQLQIVEHLERCERDFAKLLEISDQQIELLQERRTALISAAVTGKIDVRSWTAPEEPVQKGEV